LLYRNIIGALLWIARASRPDILYAVIYLAKFASCHDSQHFTAAKRVLRYPVITADYKLTYHQQPKSDKLKIRQEIVFRIGCLSERISRQLALQKASYSRFMFG